MPFLDEIFIDPMRFNLAIAEPVAAWLERIGAEEVENIKEDISIPVQHVEVNGVVFTIRSKPGEPPRTETGALLEGVSYTIEKGDGLPTLRITSSRAGHPPDVPQRLEHGRGIAPRPYMVTALIRLRERLRN